MKVIIQPALLGLLSLIAAYIVAGYFLAVSLGAQDQFTLLLYSKVVVHVTAILFLLFVGWRTWNLILFVRPKRLTHALFCDVRDRLFTREKLKQALPIFIGFLLFMSVFTSVKALIPLVQPYTWDETISLWDRTIHFGFDPWRLIQPVLGFPWITGVLNVVYNLWFVVMFLVLYWQLFDLRKPILRMRFFWTFFLTWMINGSLLATIFSSAGPCFYEHVVAGVNPYLEQMTYLQSFAESNAIWAVKTQQMLWHSYEASQIGLGSGISALPSVHVAIATLFVLLAWKYGRNFKLFFSIFAACIFVGSIHLAWHYALDGYMGAAVTIILWFITGLFFKREGG